MSFLNYLRYVLIGNRGLSGISLREHLAMYREWRDMNRSGKSPLELEFPWIALAARNFIQARLGLNGQKRFRVFEYGSGGSSAYFLPSSIELVSVEHDKEWFDLLSRWASQRATDGWSLNWVPAEPDEQPGAGDDPSAPERYQSYGPGFDGVTFKAYSSFIDRYPDGYFDLVLVDGRSRPSCLRHAAPKVKAGGLLVLDNAERPYYLKKMEWARDYSLAFSSFGAVIGSRQFSRTNAYLRK